MVRFKGTESEQEIVVESEINPTSQIKFRQAVSAVEIDPLSWAEWFSNAPKMFKGTERPPWVADDKGNFKKK